jgi:hypothetical protein
MGPRRSASQRNVSKGAGMLVLFSSNIARLNFDSHKQCENMSTASGSVPNIKVDLFPHSAKQLHQERRQDWLL